MKTLHWMISSEHIVSVHLKNTLTRVAIKIVSLQPLLGKIKQLFNLKSTVNGKTGKMFCATRFFGGNRYILGIVYLHQCATIQLFNVGMLICKISRKL